jgi:UrcA family protein
MFKSDLKVGLSKFLVSISLAGVIGIAGTSSFASAATEDQNLVRPSVTLRGLDLHPSTPASARRLLDRLGEAALEACGGSAFSLREVKAAIKESSCWRDAMGDAVRRIGSPQLTVAFERAKTLRAPV